MSIRQLAGLSLLALGWPTAAAVAQPLGTFRWQVQPYCNVLSVNVTEQAGIYTIDGTDDRCGALEAASVVGIAFLNPSGSVGFGLTIVLPTGKPVHIESTIDMSSLSGTWRDSENNSGAFVFTPGPGIGGAPRPVPTGGVAPGSITAVQIAPAAVDASHLAPDAVTGATIVDGSIATADLAAPPSAAFVDSTGQPVALASNTLVRTLTMTAPAAGRVIVNAQGYFEGTSVTVDHAACSITTGLTLDVLNAAVMAEHANAAMRFVPFALTRGFNVGAGANTFNVVCHEYSGEVGVWYTLMTASYTAQ